MLLTMNNLNGTASILLSFWLIIYDMDSQGHTITDGRTLTDARNHAEVHVWLSGLPKAEA